MDCKKLNMKVDKPFPNFNMILFAGNEFIFFGEFVNVWNLQDFFVGDYSIK